MTSRELNLKLLNYLPEIKEKYDEEVSWQDGDDTGSHVVFGDVVFPYIVEHKEDSGVVRNCFAVIENLLKTNDEYAEEVVLLSVLENLLHEQPENRDWIEFMGEKTKVLYAELMKDY